MNATHQQDELVDEAAACRLIGGSSTPIHRSTLWRGINAGRYPKPLKISASTNRWRASELAAVIEKAAAARNEVAA
ncbi:MULTISPECIES: AlpA family phage regulatory protein [unclassified Mesorhizobium]|uniref:helix-turn-helix transcriptional regulator n=1 Tax=unclassified Mesorhizobium TaxID=325217 RepID=UPI000FCCB7CA|nr:MULTISPECIES: AlpA family phage regulatory protein [unclassified Mesorhizobium]RUX97156.1 AlpA family phage regulatory protein [Mesorhizobium sp. M7D.F.Ca.US.004.01.2.1]RVA28288.1 AlpA family phage regulatory protein [Mesorhizobium sp. M7D.F.Ca.US.004.03.1.1]